MSPRIPNKKGLLIQQNLTFLSKSLVKQSPLHGPPVGPLWRVMLCFQSQWFIYSFIHSYLSESPVKELSHKTGETHMVTIDGAPRGQKACIQWGVAWFPKGIVFDTAISTPLPCSLQHNTFHFGLGRLEPC